MLIQNGEWLKRPAQSAGTSGSLDADHNAPHVTQMVRPAQSAGTSGLLYAGHNALRVTICINSWLKKTR
jgi:hypothetical protein